MARKRRSEVRTPEGEGAPEEAAKDPEEAPSKKDLAGNPFGGADGLSFPKPREMERGFNTIVRSVYDDELDVQEEYRVCEAALRVRDALTPGALERAANESEEMARRAYRLKLVAKDECDSYIQESDAIIGAIREAATSKLQDEKDKGLRSKQITDKDVAGMAAQSWPDEWQAANERRRRIEGMLKYIGKLAELLEKRSYTLSSMLRPHSKL